MKRTLWVVLLLSACSGPRGTEFARGTTVAPPPAAARAGVGAPVVGQPGASAPLPRSPHKRYLPPQKEAGVWAGDGRAGTTTALIDVFGVKVPILDTPESGFNPATVCAVIVQNGVAAGLGLTGEVMALTPGARECFVTNAMLDCMRYRERVHARAARDDTGPHTIALRAKFRRDIDKTIDMLTRHGTLVCSKDDLAALGDLLTRWGIAAFSGTPPKGGLIQ